MIVSPSSGIHSVVVSTAASSSNPDETATSTADTAAARPETAVKPAANEPQKAETAGDIFEKAGETVEKAAGEAAEKIASLRPPKIASPNEILEFSWNYLNKGFDKKGQVLQGLFMKHLVPILADLPVLAGPIGWIGIVPGMLIQGQGEKVLRAAKLYEKPGGLARILSLLHEIQEGTEKSIERVPEQLNKLCDEIIEHARPQNYKNIIDPVMHLKAKLNGPESKHFMQIVKANAWLNDQPLFGAILKCSRWFGKKIGFLKPISFMINTSLRLVNIGLHYLLGKIKRIKP